MAEQIPAPEAKSSYDEAVDELFVMLNNNHASQPRIREVLACLFSEAAHQPEACQDIIENWATRYEYDVDGILTTSGSVVTIDVDDELDNESIKYENKKIANNKFRLLSDITAFLIASQNSKISQEQKEVFIGRAQAFFDARLSPKRPQLLIGKAAAPYIAYDFEQAEMGNNSDERIARGAYVLKLLRRQLLIQWSQSKRLRAALRRVRSNSPPAL